MTDMIFGGIDAGGTTFKCVVADGAGTILAQQRVPTTSPEQTIAACVAFFQAQSGRLQQPLRALGIGSFGPLDVDPASARYGTILSTPKPGWAHTLLSALFAEALGCEVSIDTDVNAALRAEMRWGAARGATSAAYITVGTGIGAGIFANGAMLGLPDHPEYGHILVQRHKSDPGGDGICPFHGDCLEGMASALAFTRRYGDPKMLPLDHPGWRMEAFYLAQACTNLILTLRPQKIVLGGGLLLKAGFLPMVHEAAAQILNNYLELPPGSLESGIVTAGLGDDAGVMGALALVL